MPWRKLGRVFVAEGQRDWMRTHAAWPRAAHLRDDVFRVFFSARDAQNQSHIGFVDVDVKNPTEILSISSTPVLSPRPAGSFDESGVIPCDIIRIGGRSALYYAGIAVRTGGSFESFPGLAYLDESLSTATRGPATPLLGRSAAEPFSGGAVCVRRDEGRDTFHMWYESCVGFLPGPSGLVPRFTIKHAVSADGVSFKRLDETCIGGIPDRPYVSNPSVRIDENIFRMWYSFKVGDRYRIGYAESGDGARWTLMDDRAGIAISESGWDSEEVTYPSVFEHGKDLYMLYNGNQYGRTGFGIARMTGD